MANTWRQRCYHHYYHYHHHHYHHPIVKNQLISYCNHCRCRHPTFPPTQSLHSWRNCFCACESFDEKSALRKYHSVSFPFSPRRRCSSVKTLLVLTIPLAKQTDNLFVFPSICLEMGRYFLGNSIIVALISVWSRFFQIIIKDISQWLDCLGSWNITHKTNDQFV